MKNHFKNKIVWITGGGSGLGKAMALEYGRLGAQVAVSGRRAEKLAETVKEVEHRGGIGLAVPCDVGQAEQIESAANQVIQQFGSLDVVVANAAFPLKAAVENLEADDLRRQFDVNVIGATLTAKHALPELRKTKGRLALVGSAASVGSAPLYGAYNASKYALRAIGQTLALELHGSGVSCTLIYPGGMDTEFVQIDNSGHFNPNKKRITNRWMWTAEKSARVCISAIHKRKREFTFSFVGTVWCWFGAHTPGLLHFLITRFGMPGSETLYAS